MQSGSFTLIEAERTVSLPATVEGATVRVASESLAARLGWELKSEGLCKGALCVPVRDRSDLAEAAGVDLNAFAELLERPLALDVDERVAVLGDSAGERGRALARGEAPDFTLPDLQGRLHSLSDQRGKKVLLIAHASW